jgi:hypothetical protein
MEVTADAMHSGTRMHGITDCSAQGWMFDGAIGEVLEHPRTGIRGVMDLELGELPLYEIECIDSVCC